MKRLLCFAFITSMISFNLYSQKYDPVVLNSAHVRTLKSNIVEGMEYILNIALPPDCHDTTINYPVVYMLDAYENFGLQLQTYQQQLYEGHIPPMILVGINYNIDGKSFYEGLNNYFYIRARDYTPTFLTPKQIQEKHSKGFAYHVQVSGGGEKFLSFFREELFPFIELEYRADLNDRGLLGYSLGGLFSTYVLFDDPTAFQKYFIGSAPLFWDDKAVYKFYNKNKLNTLKEPVKVYLSIGENENQRKRDSWQQLKKFLEQKSHPKILLKSEMLPDEYHLTGIGLAYSRAFRRLYGK